METEVFDISGAFYLNVFLSLTNALIEFTIHALTTSISNYTSFLNLFKDVSLKNSIV